MVDFSLVQLLVHLFGDYFLQSDKQAGMKKKPGWNGTWACLKHCTTYALPFAFLVQPGKVILFPILVIFGTHFLIDRYHLVPWLIWAKNRTIDYPSGLSWSSAKTAFGVDPSRPPWLAGWICIIVDNLLHLVINGLALKYL